MHSNRPAPTLLGLVWSRMASGLPGPLPPGVTPPVQAALRDDARLCHHVSSLGKIRTRRPGRPSMGAWRGGRIWNWRRTEKNRHPRECRAVRSESTREEIDRPLFFFFFFSLFFLSLSLFFFLKKKKKKKKGFLSLANGYQLRSRVLKKFRTYDADGPM